VSGKTTPEICGKQVENVWAEIEEAVGGLVGGWWELMWAGRLPPVSRLNGRCLDLARIVSGRIGSLGPEEEMPGKCRLQIENEF
jgi:hypothetical protein